MIKDFSKWINKYYPYIYPTLIFIGAVLSLFRNHSFSEEFVKDHPIRFALLSPIVEYSLHLLILVAFIILLTTLIEIFNRKTIKYLENENEKYKMLSETISENIKELFNGFLYSFANSKAAFTSGERITLYIHNGEDSFIPFGRYSSNPKFSKPGRDSYPDHQGCIAKGWENEWYFDNTLANAETDRKKYIQENKDKYLIDIKTTKKMKMKSTLFAIMRLDIKDIPLAVVVVESIEANKYTENQIKLFLGEQQVYLAELVAGLERYIPKPSNAIAIEEI